MKLLCDAEYLNVTEEELFDLEHGGVNTGLLIVTCHSDMVAIPLTLGDEESGAHLIFASHASVDGQLCEPLVEYRWDTNMWWWRVTPQAAASCSEHLTTHDHNFLVYATKKEVNAMKRLNHLLLSVTHQTPV